MGDYWPNYGKVMPVNFADENLESGKLVEKDSNSALYELSIKEETEIMFPINYFPGWEASIGGQKVSTYHKEGLITSLVPAGDYMVSLNFKNTFVRTIGNTLSVISLGVWIYLYKKFKNKKIKK